MQEAIEKADVLIEAMGWIRRFRDKVTVIKLGGSVMEDPEALDHLLLDIVFMETVGMRPIVVHGGGAAITRAMAEANIEARFIQGRRYTDEATLGIVEKVLAGEINENIAKRIEEFGGRAMPLNFVGETNNNVLVGERLTLTGKDGEEIDLGAVGHVTRVDREILDNLCYAGQVPVIPSMCETGDGARLNVNADTAATAVAQAVGAEKLVFFERRQRRAERQERPGVADPFADGGRGAADDRGWQHRGGDDPQSRGVPGNAEPGGTEDSHHRRASSALAAVGDLHESGRGDGARG